MTKSIAAVLFVFRRGKDTDRAELDSCTGWIKYRGIFPERGTYEFTFVARLSKGGAAVILLKGKKEQVMRLDRQSPTGRVTLEAGSRYDLRWEFQHATGRCALRWRGFSTPV